MGLLQKYKMILIAICVLVVLISGFVIAKNTNLMANFKKSAPQPIQNLIPEIKNEEQVRVSVQSGQVTVQNGDLNKTLSKDDSQEVKNGDIITTNAQAIATVNYPEGTVIRMAPNSVITITNETTTTNINQTAGSIFIRFKKVLGVQEELNVDNQTAVATIRGTKLVSKIDAKINESKFMALEHDIDVYKKDKKTNKKLENTKQILKEGYQVQSRKTGYWRVAKQLLTDDDKKWIDLNKDEFEDKGKKEMIQEAVSKYFQSPTPKPTTNPSSSPKASASVAPITYASQMFGAGYSSGYVKTERGDFKLSCYGAAQGSVKVLTDSASESDCKNDCPVLPLADYATRNNGVAAINGMYFCPGDYPACADKKNSFDTLFFNS
ncbi:FecR domain-containing protein, partial [Candidatus Microgenomates bacterium]|nr:FecR domain-containing protein [Candidatus Microgenomates bacterium]